jgi:hypothetical protein
MGIPALDEARPLGVHGYSALEAHRAHFIILAFAWSFQL